MMFLVLLWVQRYLHAANIGHDDRPGTTQTMSSNSRNLHNA